MLEILDVLHSVNAEIFTYKFQSRFLSTTNPICAPTPNVERFHYRINDKELGKYGASPYS
jgi:hypothetical protein